MAENTDLKKQLVRAEEKNMEFSILLKENGAIKYLYSLNILINS